MAGMPIATADPSPSTAGEVPAGGAPTAVHGHRNPVGPALTVIVPIVVVIAMVLMFSSHSPRRPALRFTGAVRPAGASPP
ncbi:hypothetical protein ACFCX0_00360 [Streptomyces sp. NPDC056352]|uniref:hypothetical protein n=1 Tax=Streptomyces sp. NPDC056352 TaxID=3345791 RepID=UPI0035D7A48A